MNYSGLEPCVELPIPTKHLNEVVEKAKDWLLMHGACMRSKQQSSGDAIQYTPFVLLPTSFPREEFKKATAVQTILNELTHKVAHDHSFITESLKRQMCIVLRNINFGYQNLFFCPPAGKWQLSGRCAKRSCHFPAPSSRKIVYTPWPVKKEASDHMFVSLGFASANNYITVEVDDFTARLYRIYETIYAEGFTQNISLGLLRSDYLMHSLCNHNILQVELNTIASSFAGISTVITQYHRYILKELDQDDQLQNIPDNNALSGLCDGLIDAWKLYNNEKAVILFVVEDITLNICDQRFHEFEIRQKNPSIKIIRKSLGNLASEAHLGHDQELFVGDFTIAVVYFRSGYEPAQYPTEHEWSARLMIERSRAIKCPSIQYHLAGTKKLQQALAVSGALEKYFVDKSVVEKIKRIFTGLYSLDFDEGGERAVAMGLKEPEKYVLKPQREGGGNNIYDENVRTKLEAMKNSNERTAWILMDRIRPPLQKNYLLRPGDSNELDIQDVVTELGIYGVILGTPNEILINKQVGHILRTKPSNENEGGVVAGIGALDSPYLIL